MRFRTAVSPRGSRRCLECQREHKRSVKGHHSPDEKTGVDKNVDSVFSELPSVITMRLKHEVKEQQRVVQWNRAVILTQNMEERQSMERGEKLGRVDIFGIHLM